MSVLFFNSFRAEQTLFSNDGPLGAITSEQGSTPDGFAGAWIDLNWVGYRQPSASPNITSLLSLLFGPLFFSKFYVPCALLILGLSAWTLLRQLGFKSIVCVLGGFAIALNTDPFSYACWGLASLPLTMAAAFLALGSLAHVSTKGIGLRTCLAGLAVGLGIMEGYDNGAIFSLYVAAFAVFQSWCRAEPAPRRIFQGLQRVAIVALLAALMSAHTLSELIGTQITGIAGMQQDRQAKEQRWDWATQWSLPKVEALRIVVPGLFGYRMDTAEGGNYWGAVGQQPGWEQHQQGYPRHSGSGVYAGVLVVLIAGWGLCQSFRGSRSPYSLSERKFIWFWGATAIISLLLAFGRHAPFYQFFYALPYFSTIRNPIKFIHPFQVALLLLFACGLQDLTRRYLTNPLSKPLALGTHLKKWWASAPTFDRKWTMASVGLLALSFLGWLLYASSNRELQAYLSTVGFTPSQASAISTFSFREVGWFILLLALAVALINVIISGWFEGARSRIAKLFLGCLLVFDLSRANEPWIVYYNYTEKYASNAVIDILRDKPYEHRVAGRLMPLSGQHLTDEQGSFFSAIYDSWLQHPFQYYNVQSLDIIQMPRMSALDKALLDTLRPTSANQLALIGRLWQITNTRYVLGMTGFLEMLNQQIDPLHRRFRIHTAFNFVRRSATPATESATLEELATALQPNGRFAIFEFTGALPRASLYSHWQISTNDSDTLKQLASAAFEPAQTVLVASKVGAAPSDNSTHAASGTVTITSYHPKLVELKAEVTKPAVLLLNDKYDPDWKVWVDGKPEALLRCNYIMKGVYLQPGNHTVEFRYQPRITGLYVSLAAIAAGLVLCSILVLAPEKVKVSAPPAEPVPAHPKPKI